MRNRRPGLFTRAAGFGTFVVAAVLFLTGDAPALAQGIKVAPGIELFTSKTDLLAAAPTLANVAFPLADTIGLTLIFNDLTISAPEASETNWGGRGMWKLVYDVFPLSFSSPPGQPLQPKEGILVANGEDDYLIEVRTPVTAVGLAFITNRWAEESITILDDQKKPVQVININKYTEPHTKHFIGIKAEKPFKYLLFDTANGRIENEGIVEISVAARRGMTWVLESRNPTAGTILVGCGNACDPRNGDHACSEQLPLLCIRNSGPGFPLSVPVAVNNTDTYSKWSGGVVATTAPMVPPLALADADTACVNAFGTGWRVAEFHDGWGWKFQAYGGIGDPARRFWVHINDQPLGNCWR